MFREHVVSSKSFDNTTRDQDGSCYERETDFQTRGAQRH